MLNASSAHNHVSEEEEEIKKTKEVRKARFHGFGFHRGAIFVDKIITLNNCKQFWQMRHINKVLLLLLLFIVVINSFVYAFRVYSFR